MQRSYLSRSYIARPYVLRRSFVPFRRSGFSRYSTYKRNPLFVSKPRPYVRKACSKIVKRAQNFIYKPMPNEPGKYYKHPKAGFIAVTSNTNGKTYTRIIRENNLRMLNTASSVPNATLVANTPEKQSDALARLAVYREEERKKLRVE